MTKLEMQLRKAVRSFRKHCGPITTRILLPGEPCVPKFEHGYGDSTEIREDTGCALLWAGGWAPIVAYYPFSTEPAVLRRVLAKHFYGDSADEGYPRALLHKTPSAAKAWLAHCKQSGTPVTGSPDTPAELSFGNEQIRLSPYALKEDVCGGRPFARLIKKRGLCILDGLLPPAQQAFLTAVLDEMNALRWIRENFDITSGIGDEQVLVLVPKDKTKQTAEYRRWELKNPPCTDKAWGNSPQAILLRKFYPMLWLRLLGGQREFEMAALQPGVSNIAPGANGYAAYHELTLPGGRTVQPRLGHGTVRNLVLLKAEDFIGMSVSLTNLPEPRDGSWRANEFTIRALRDSGTAWVDVLDNSVLFRAGPEEHTPFVYQLTTDTGYCNILSVLVSNPSSGRTSYVRPKPPQSPIYRFEPVLRCFVRI